MWGVRAKRGQGGDKERREMDPERFKKWNFLATFPSRARYLDNFITTAVARFLNYSRKNAQEATISLVCIFPYLLL